MTSGNTQKWQIPSTVYPRETTKTTGLPPSERSGMIVIVLAPRGDFLMEERMRKLFILFGFALLVASIAQAQETRGMEVSGQYQYVRIYPGQCNPSANCQGAGGTFAANLNRWVGVVGDVCFCKVTGLPTGFSTHEINYLFVPRFFFFNDTATTEIYTLSLHDALPISSPAPAFRGRRCPRISLACGAPVK